MNPNVKSALQMAGVILVASVAMTVARRLDLIDGDSATRICMAAIGLVIAWYGNITPKETVGGSARRQAYRRVAGYAMAAAGLVNAAIWTWAPMTYAAELSMVPMAAALVAIVGYCFWSRGTPAQA